MNPVSPDTDARLQQALAAASIHAIADVVELLRQFDSILPEDDGLKWFNWLYLKVTEAVANALLKNGWQDREWVELLDVRFAERYFDALREWLQQSPATPGCWALLFSSRRNADLARIQFALAGINAHINYDLCTALVTTCQERQVTPTHGGPEYQDYSSLNSTLATVTDAARQELRVGLAGQELPELGRIEDLAASWSVGAAREAAWTNSEVLWNLRHLSPLFNRYVATLDGLAQLSGHGLLAPVGV